MTSNNNLSGGNFLRGTVESSSVRLRKRKDLLHPDSLVKRRNRHSGDFLVTTEKGDHMQFLSRLSNAELMDSMETLDRKMLNRPRPATTVCTADPYLRLKEDAGSKSESELLSPSAEEQRKRYLKRPNNGKSSTDRRSFDLALRGSSNNIHQFFRHPSEVDRRCRTRSNNAGRLSRFRSDEYDSMLETTTQASSAVLSCVTTSGEGYNNTPAVKKGLVWFQRDKFFARWKERFLVVSPDYIQCFKRNTSSSSATDMGGFIFKIKLSDVDKVELIDKRGSLTLGLYLTKDGKIWLRKPEEIREWYEIIKECVSASKERRGMMKSSKEFWSKKQFGDVLLINGDLENSRHPHHLRRNGGLTKEYGFIDMPKPDEHGGAGTDYKTDEDVTPPPPPQYSSGTSCSKDSSGSNKSRDSGIDSIEKSGRGDLTKAGDSKFVRSSDLVVYRRRQTQSGAGNKHWRRSDHCVSDIIDEFPNLWDSRRGDEGFSREKDPPPQHRRYSHYLIPTTTSTSSSPKIMNLSNNGINPQITKL